jgi:hypothetical protein
MCLLSSPDYPPYISENQLVPMIYWVGSWWYTHGKLKMFQLWQNPPFVQYKQEIPTLQMSYHQMLTTILTSICSLALLTYSLIPRLYGPLRTSTSFIIYVYTHSSVAPGSPTVGARLSAHPPLLLPSLLPHSFSYGPLRGEPAVLIRCCWFLAAARIGRSALGRPPSFSSFAYLC